MNHKIDLSIPRVVIASGNLGKVSEFRKLLSELPVMIIPQPDDIQIEETGRSFVENARVKALTAAKITGQFSLADDSGLSVESLGGAPGIFSSRYANTDSERINKLLYELTPFKNRKAFFSAALCFVSPENRILFEVEGKCEGRITEFPRGNDGFGYDPIFEVKNTGLTFAEMGIERKKSFSHRGLAFQKLMPKLKKYFASIN